MIRMAYEREMDTIYEKMNNEKKGQLIDAINDALKIGYGGSGNVALSDDTINDDLKMKAFLSEYVRTDDEVFEGMINYLDITCSEDYLNKEAIIDADNDYLSLIEGLHLNVYCIFDCDYDELMEDGVLVEL